MPKYTKVIKNKMKKACKSGKWSEIEPLLKEHGNELASIGINNNGPDNYISGSKIKPLHYIAYYAPDNIDSAESIKLLVTTKSAYVNTVNHMPWHLTPLHMASDQGKVHLVEELLKCGANPYAIDKAMDWTPAGWCCWHLRGLSEENKKRKKSPILSLLKNPPPLYKSKNEELNIKKEAVVKPIKHNNPFDKYMSCELKPLE